MRFYEIELLSAPQFAFAWRVDTDARSYRNFFDRKPDFLEISIMEAGKTVAEHPDGTAIVHSPGILGVIASDMTATCYACGEGRIRHTTAAVRVKYNSRRHNSESCDISGVKARVKEGNIALIPVGEAVGEAYDSILNVLKKIVALKASEEPADKLGAVAQWYQLLSLVTEFTLRKLDTEETGILPSERNYAVKAVKYINRNYTEKRKVGDIADHLGISEGYLHRVFKRVEGCSVLEYLNRKRVYSAIELMETKNLNLKEAAYNVGIDDPAYMSRLFKKIMGISVRDYFREKPVDGWQP